MKYTFQRRFFAQLMLQDQLAIHAKGGNEFPYFEVFDQEFTDLNGFRGRRLLFDVSKYRPRISPIPQIEN